MAEPPAGLQPLLVPSVIRDPRAATVPFEAFVPTHPDHDDWVQATGKCHANPTCPTHTPTHTPEETP